MSEKSTERDTRPLIEQIEGLPLLGLIESLKISNNKPLKTMCEPLPETIRINPLMQDFQHTIKLIESYGGIKIEWCSGNLLAYKMPWTRGKQPSMEIKKMMQVLHQTGRVTQQEEVSMLPVQLLNPKEGETVLDACAAPGSKTTQLAEWTSEKAVIIGNEINPGRVNTLVSNTKRLGLHSVTITKHDARSYPKVPLPGFDAAIVDAPCSGSGTMRKNLDVWWKWKPNSARSLQNLQVGIAERAAKLLKPGGRMVYSTCSLDPVENEAVVAELIRKCPWMEIEEIDVEKMFPSLEFKNGMSAWELLDVEGNIAQHFDGLLGVKESHIEPGTSVNGSLIVDSNRYRDQQVEEKIAKALKNCVRIYPHDNNTGGFFLALLRQTDDDHDFARALRKLNSGTNHREFLPRQSKYSPSEINLENMKQITKSWGVPEKNNYSWWERGRTIAIANELTKSWLFDSQRLDKDGYLVQGGYWHPLNVIHTGSVAFEFSDKFGFRPKSKAIGLLSELISENRVLITKEILNDLLVGNLPTKSDLQNDNSLSEQTRSFFQTDRIGAILLEIDNSEFKLPIPAWFASKLSLMVDDNEKIIIKKQMEDSK